MLHRICLFSQTESNLKLTQESVGDLERAKMELSQAIQRKEKELGSLGGKVRIICVQGKKTKKIFFG